MSTIATALGWPRSRSRAHGLDLADRLHARWTPALLFALAAALGAWYYGTRPITCWAPPDFTNEMTENSKDFCWAKQGFPRYNSSSSDAFIKFGQYSIAAYHWVPIILFLEGVFFLLPSLTWRYLKRLAALDLDALLSAAESASAPAADIDTRRRLVLLASRTLTPAHGSLLGEFERIYLVCLFAAFKLLCVLNTGIQLFIVTSLLWPGLFPEQTNLATSGIFPPEFLCDRYVQGPRNILQYRMQCFLPANFIFEKVFEFLMLWLLGLLLALTKSLVLWILVLCVPFLRRKFVRDSLELALGECTSTNEAGADRESGISGCVTPAEKKRFLRSLSINATFALLHLRSSPHVSPLVRADIVRELWRTYQKTTVAKSAPLDPTPTDPSPSGGIGYGAQQTFQMTERTQWQQLPSVTVTQEGEVRA